MKNKVIANARHHRSCQLFLLLIVAGLLTACGRTTLPTRTTTEIATKSALAYDRFGVCWPGEFDRSTIANPILPAAANEFIGGYHNHVRRGQSCHTQESFGYSGAFRFDLDDLRNKIIVGASLHVDRRNTPVTINVERQVPSGVVQDDQCPLLVEIATEPWSLGASAGSFTSRAIPADRPTALHQDQATISAGVGVTWAVQQWVLGRIPNLGFVIKSEPGKVDKNENTCTGYWFNPRLDITIVTPATE